MVLDLLCLGNRLGDWFVGKELRELTSSMTDFKRTNTFNIVGMKPEGSAVSGEVFKV